MLGKLDDMFHAFVPLELIPPRFRSFFARLDLFLAVPVNEAVATRKNHPSKLANSRRVGLQSFEFPSLLLFRNRLSKVKDAKSRIVERIIQTGIDTIFEVTNWEFRIKDRYARVGEKFKACCI